MGPISGIFWKSNRSRAVYVGLRQLMGQKKERKDKEGVNSKGQSHITFSIARIQSA